jgi:hypothetical protein
MEVAITLGQTKIPIEFRTLIRRMSLENPLWGAPRLHGELLKLGIEVAQSTVAKPARKVRPDVGDLPAQSCGRYRRHGLPRRADDQLSAPVCIGDIGVMSGDA